MEKNVFQFRSNDNDDTTRGGEPSPLSDAQFKQILEQEKQKRPNGIKLLPIILLAIAVVAIGSIVFIINDNENSDAVEETTEAAADTSDEIPEIPEGAIEYNGHHYKVYDTAMRWDEAEKECENAGGHLAIVDNRGKQLKIKEIIEESGVKKYHYWIGGTKRNGTWEWINGDPIPLPRDNWGYQNWEKDKPNNNKKAAGITGNEDYLEIQTTDSMGDYMTWNDIDIDGIAISYEESPKFCDTKHFGYICEWDD